MPENRKRRRSVAEESPKSKKVPVNKNVKEFMNEVNENCGANTMRMARDNPLACHIPTGCFVLDMALVGGFTEGHAAMIYGYKSSGKTTTVIHGIANYQKKHPDKYVLFVDAERMLDKLWAEKLGVNLDKLIHTEPETGEQAVDIIDSALQRKEIGLIVLDSIPAIVPYKEAEASAQDDFMALRARLCGKMCSSITVRWAQGRREGHFASVWLINQWRVKLGVMFGDPRSLPGGFQIQHLPSTMLELKLKKEVEGEDQYGNPIHDHNDHVFKLAKHKIAPSIPHGEYAMTFNPDGDLPQGSFDDMGTVITFAKRMGYITGGGASWRVHTISEDMGHDVKFRKASEIKAHLIANDDQYRSLRKTLVAHQRRNVGLEPIPPDGFLLSHEGSVHLLDID